MWPCVDEARGNDDNLRRSRFGSTVAAAAAAARYSRYRSIATWLGFHDVRYQRSDINLWLRKLTPNKCDL